MYINNFYQLIKPARDFDKHIKLYISKLCTLDVYIKFFNLCVFYFLLFLLAISQCIINGFKLKILEIEKWIFKT